MSKDNPHKPMACVILAGGRGSRMASDDLHKVCFPVAGRPAIVRAIDTYKAAGLRHFVVVVGQMARQVIETVASAHPDVAFVYQSNPRGTGHAAMVAADYLAASGYEGDVMVTMGDKIATSDVVCRMLDEYRSCRCDLLVATLALSDSSSAGRIVSGRNGKLLGVVEVKDLNSALASGGKFSFNGREFSAKQVEKNARQVNASLYCVDFKSLQAALATLDDSNAQGELYLTDIVSAISADGVAHAAEIDDPTQLMAFNTPAELLELERVVQARQKQPRLRGGSSHKKLSDDKFKSAAAWLKLLKSNSSAAKKTFASAYGSDGDLLAERRAAMIALVEKFIKAFGPRRKMILCRAPGRLNLMGRHVDHRGGYVNVMAISREVLLAAAPRADDVVTLVNTDSRNFPPREFRIFDLLSDASWSDWLDFVNSRSVKNFLADAGGDWSNYARAVLLRLQHECRDIPLKGMDCVVSGNIPHGAGLSSSSALVVAFAEAALAVNSLTVKINDFIDLCGEGEWFVGTRGGSSDHAAIRTSRIGEISRIGFFPFHLSGSEKFPGDLSVVVAYSGHRAVKSAGAKDAFNQRIISYELAELFLRRYLPAAADAKCLRDMMPESLGISDRDLYLALRLLPDKPNIAEFSQLIALADQPKLQEIVAGLPAKGRFDLRGVVLYGLAEMARSQRFAALLAGGDVRRAGEFMNISHDGDRCYRMDASGNMKRYNLRLTDAGLSALADADTDLATVPGRYRCSTCDIDFMVDIANKCEGVLGAQLAGAGLGGCMMVLVEKAHCQQLLGELEAKFYKPRKLTPEAVICQPVAGAGVVSV